MVACWGNGSSTGQPAGIPGVLPTYRPRYCTNADRCWSVQFCATTVAVATCPGISCGTSKVSEVIWIVPEQAGAAACAGDPARDMPVATAKAVMAVASNLRMEPPGNGGSTECRDDAALGGSACASRAR